MWHFLENPQSLMNESTLQFQLNRSQRKAKLLRALALARRCGWSLLYNQRMAVQAPARAHIDQY